MNTMKLIARSALLLLAALMLAFPGVLRADELHLKDGRVLQGEVIREGDGFIFFRVMIGGIEQNQFFPLKDVSKLVRDADSTQDVDNDDPGVAPPPVAASDPVKSPRKAPKDKLGAARVAVLNFGPPNAWQGEIDSTVGIQISAKAWEDAVPLLEADGVEIVIVRINSGGGYLLEIEKFHEVFQNEYKPRFRTVCWVESAISAAAMSPWVIEEIYFLPDGSMGACTGWFGALQAVTGVELEKVLALMERASAMGGRDSKIMRSMQIREPLSCDFDGETGEVTWRQDTGGSLVVNPEGRILTFIAPVAEETGFSSGTAATLEDLMRLMGVREWTLGGDRATDYIDQNMRDADKTEKRFREIAIKYQMAVQFAQGAPAESTERGAQVGRARRYLREMRRMVGVNPNFEFALTGFQLNDEWFEQQEEMLRELLR